MVCMFMYVCVCTHWNVIPFRKKASEFSAIVKCQMNVLTNSLTDSLPYVASVFASFLGLTRENKSPVLADRCCTQSRPNGPKQHMQEWRKPHIIHIYVIVNRIGNLSHEVTCIRQKHLGEMLGRLSLFPKTTLISSFTLAGEPYGNTLLSLFSVMVNRIGKMRLAGENSAVHVAQQQEPLTLEFGLWNNSIDSDHNRKVVYLPELLTREQHSSSFLLFEAMVSVLTKTRKKLCRCNASLSRQDLCSDMAQKKGYLSVFLESVVERKAGILAWPMWEGAKKGVTTQRFRFF